MNIYILEAIRKGLTFHGLRHTVERSWQTLGQAPGLFNPQQVETYVATAIKKRLAKRGIALIDENKV